MYYTVYAGNNEDADQTVQMHRLICVFVVHIYISRFSHDVAQFPAYIMRNTSWPIMPSVLYNWFQHRKANTNGKCSLSQKYNNTIVVFTDCIKFSNDYSKWRYFLFASSIFLTQTESEHSFEKCRRIQIDKNRQNFPSFIFRRWRRPEMD